MAQFLIRLVNYYATEVVAKGLANSPTFQRFAVRTHSKVGVDFFCNLGGDISPISFQGMDDHGNLLAT